MNNNKHEFTTTSLALAAAILLTSDSKLHSVFRTPDSKRVSFVFTQTESLNHLIELFWQKALPVDAFSFYENLKYLKSRVYEEKPYIS